MTKSCVLFNTSQLIYSAIFVLLYYSILYLFCTRLPFHLFLLFFYQYLPDFTCAAPK